MPRRNVDLEPRWTVADVAEFLHLTPETVRHYASVGKLPAIKLGDHKFARWRFDPVDVRAYGRKYEARAS